MNPASALRVLDEILVLRDQMIEQGLANKTNLNQMVNLIQSLRYTKIRLPCEDGVAYMHKPFPFNTRPAQFFNRGASYLLPYEFFQQNKYSFDKNGVLSVEYRGWQEGDKPCKDEFIRWRQQNKGLDCPEYRTFIKRTQEIDLMAILESSKAILKGIDRINYAYRPIRDERFWEDRW